MNVRKIYRNKTGKNPLFPYNPSSQQNVSHQGGVTDEYVRWLEEELSVAKSIDNTPDNDLSSDNGQLRQPN